MTAGTVRCSFMGTGRNSLLVPTGSRPCQCLLRWKLQGNAQFASCQRLQKDRCARVERLALRKRADDDRFEPGVAHEPSDNRDRFLVVAAQWHRHLLARAMRLAQEHLVVQLVE